jgi:hypothetical protein
MDSNMIQLIADALDTHSNQRRFATELTELANTISTNEHSLANLPNAEFDAWRSLQAAGHAARTRQLAIITEMMERAFPAPPPPVVCGKCHGPIEDPFKFRGVDYCCMQCCHDAGDRRHCRRGVCGCTGFAIKRRQLREHRQKMRVLERLIVDNGLEDELEEAMEEDGYPDRVWDDAEMDERSDAEDPMVTQANELSNIDSIVQLSHNMVELAGVRRDLKRARDSD